MKEKTTVKCSICGADAVIGFQVIANGVMRTLNLCPDHAVEAREAALAFLSEGNHSSRQEVLPSDRVCPSCEISFAQVMRSGRLGCPACYDAFEDILPPSLVGQTHVGKAPQSALDRALFGRRIDYWQRRMNEAVADERYESAAEYRDLIHGYQRRYPQFSTSNNVGEN